MLRFVPKFDFAPIFKKIQQLRPGNEILTQETCNIALVGHERTGRVILSHSACNAVLYFRKKKDFQGYN